MTGAVGENCAKILTYNLCAYKKSVKKKYYQMNCSWERKPQLIIFADFFKTPIRTLKKIAYVFKFQSISSIAVHSGEDSK